MTPEYSTQIQKAVAPGYETRLSYGIDPIYHFELNYEVLRENAAFNELRRLIGFFNARRGDFDSFLLNLSTLTQNPKDGSVTTQVLTPDVSGYAPIVITRDGDTENVYELAGVNGNPGVAPVIFMGGVPMIVGSDYTILGPGVAVAGATYPGLVAVITKAVTGIVTATFSWYYRVRFEENKQEMALFSYLFWKCQSLKLVQTRTD